MKSGDRTPFSTFTGFGRLGREKCRCEREISFAENGPNCPTARGVIPKIVGWAVLTVLSRFRSEAVISGLRRLALVVKKTGRSEMAFYP